MRRVSLETCTNEITHIHMQCYLSTHADLRAEAEDLLARLYRSMLRTHGGGAGMGAANSPAAVDVVVSIWVRVDVCTLDDRFGELCKLSGVC